MAIMLLHAAEEFKRQFSKECVIPTEYPACQVYEWYMEYITEGEKTSEGLLTVFFRSLFNAYIYQFFVDLPSFPNMASGSIGNLLNW